MALIPAMADDGDLGNVFMYEAAQLSTCACYCPYFGGTK